MTSDISSNNNIPVRGTSHEVLLHASSPSMDNVATNSGTYINTSPIIGYKICATTLTSHALPASIIKSSH